MRCPCRPGPCGGVAAGGFFSVALKSDHTVLAWGDNQFNQTLIPSDATNVIAISAGRGHVLALKSNGSVEAWGSDIYGQCDVPAGLTNVAGVLAGWNYSLARRADGTVQAWGADDAGQTDVPAGLNHVMALAANMEYCLALKSDGTVVAWGAAPQPPAGLTGVKAIAAGEDHCLALLSDGTIAAWGSDDSGQTDVPAGLTAITALGAGWNYSVALAGRGISPGVPNISGPSWATGGAFSGTGPQPSKQILRSSVQERSVRPDLDSFVSGVRHWPVHPVDRPRPGSFKPLLPGAGTLACSKRVGEARRFWTVASPLACCFPGCVSLRKKAPASRTQSIRFARDLSGDEAVRRLTEFAQRMECGACSRCFPGWVSPSARKRRQAGRSPYASRDDEHGSESSQQSDCVPQQDVTGL